MVSIIIVHYHVKKELFAAIQSILASKPKATYEIIVVDNDEKKTIQTDLKKHFPHILYIPNENKGFGQGNNVGANYAKGEFLFFLNPDTTLFPQCIDLLVSYLERHSDIGIVAPLLYDDRKKIVSLQGARELTPLRAIFSFSFINKYFPKNPIVRRYWYLDEWDKKIIKEVDSIPGTAFMIRQKLYKKLQGFDEHFFLYFEEHDLCKRARELGWKIVIIPSAKVFHALGRSTGKLKKDVPKIFRQSRYYYLRKHFGFLSAWGSEIILRTNKYALSLLAILFAALVIRLYYIEQSMQFIGDQGWFYISARDIVLKREIPLVGIVSSHPWLHQGAFWTYLLAPVLWLAHFNPVSGAYLSVAIGLLATLGIYFLGSTMFSKNIGLLAALLFASSPYVIFSDRMPYHTVPIPFFIICALYCLHKWIQGNRYYLPPLIMFLAVLYNFELATFLFSLIVLGIWLFGFLRKESWARGIFKMKIILLSVFGWLVVMLPMILYDMHHEFSQTVKFLVWIIYQAAVAFGFSRINPVGSVSFGDIFRFVGESYQLIIFGYNEFVALFIFAAGVIFLIVNRTKKKAYILLGAVNLALLIGLLVERTPSGAYLPMVFPGVILLIAVLFDGVVRSKAKYMQLAGFLGLICVVAFNYFSVIQKVSSDTTFSEKMEAARYIVKTAGKKEYNLLGKGHVGQFASFTTSYEYLTWWLGHGPSKKKQPINFVIEEKMEKILVTKQVVL